jgi:L-threonylcarbamoyladenylate synthase
VTNYSPAILVLNSGKVAVIPTDTIYGIVARASDQQAIKKVYQIKNRANTKPPITLIADFEQLIDFGVDNKWLEAAKKYWPGPISLIFPTNKTDINHLTKNTGTIALRLPDNNELRELIRQTGPLIAPSANPEGLPPATTIAQAQGYFGNQVAIYINNGPMPVTPSTLIDLAAKKVLR